MAAVLGVALGAAPTIGVAGAFTPRVLANTLATRVFAAGATSWLDPARRASTVLDGRHGVDPDRARGSVAYLRAAYGVDAGEAVRRLNLQAWAEQHAADLSRYAPDSYAGMWLDQQQGGRLVIAATSAPSLTPLLASVPDRAHIDVRPAGRTLAQLAALRQQLVTRLGATPDGVLLPEIDVPADEVVVWQRQWLVDAGKLTFTAAQRAALQQAVAAAGAGVETRIMPQPTELAATRTSAGQCTPLSCSGTGPMRGGMRLDIKRDDGTWGGCTSGYNVRATGGGYAGKAFVLTAGHCVLGSRHKHHDAPFHGGTQVLREQDGLEASSFPIDFALLPYKDPATESSWLDLQSRHNLVMSTCRDTGGDCTEGDTEITQIRGYEEIVTGSVVCASGAASSVAGDPNAVDSGAGAGYRPGNRCGQVTAAAAGTIDTDVCARAGDSGGPLYSEVSGAGMGILEGNLQDRRGACQPGERNNYVPLSRVLTYLDASPAAQGSTFRIITTPTG